MSSSSLLTTEHVFVISDLHVGAPDERLTNLDEFICDEVFERLLTRQIPQDAAGKPATLVINGDFLDMPQVLPELGKHDLGDKFGTTEAQSLERLERILAAHPRVFTAMRRFVESGNDIRIIPGNHDPDYCWPTFEARLREVVGGAPERFTIVREGEISERDVHIEHGHQHSYDNRFDQWPTPIIAAPGGPRLERPWGTMFMDLVYNDAESEYPFVNKVYPHSVLAAILARSFVHGKLSTRLLGRIVGFFATRGKKFLWERLLGAEDGASAAGPLTIEEVIDQIAPGLSTAERAEALQYARADLPQAPVGAPVGAPAGAPVGTLLGETSEALPEHDGAGLLGRTDERGMAARASKLFKQGVVLVIFGHTHETVDGQAPFGVDDERRVFNTGSWMPRVVVAPREKLTMDELVKREPVFGDVRYLHVVWDRFPRGKLKSIA